MFIRGKTSGPMNGDTQINDPKGCFWRFILFFVIMAALILLVRLFPFAS